MFPPNRKIKTIEQIFGDVKIGGTPSRGQKIFFGGGIPWVSIRDMGKQKEIFKTSESLSESGVHNSNVKLISKGSLLFSFKLTVGRMCFAGVDLYTNEAIASFEPNKEINLNYLYYLLPNVSQKVDRTNNYGAPLLNKSVIKSLQIPLPPLPVQHKIVAALDEASGQIETSKSALKDQIAALDQLWQSSLSEVFENKEFELVKLSDIVSIQSSNLLPSDIDIYNYIGLENVESNTGKLVDFIPTPGKNIKSNKVKFEKGMILYGKLRPYLNKVYLAEFDGIATTEILPMKTIKGVSSEYLTLFLRSKIFVDAANDSVSGARMPRVTTRFLQEYDKIPLPDLATQNRIVTQLDELSQQISLLKSEYTAQLQHFDELWASILDQAFRGELVEE